MCPLASSRTFRFDLGVREWVVAEPVGRVHLLREPALISGHDFGRALVVRQGWIRLDRDALDQAEHDRVYEELRPDRFGQDGAVPGSATAFA
jgi:hypothetical protein